MRTWTVSRMPSQRRAHRVQRRLGGRPRCRGARSARAPRSASVPWPSRNTSAARLPGREGDGDVQRRAGIEPGAEAPGQRRVARAPPAARASRCGRGTTGGRRSPSAAARWRGRRPRAPRTPGCRRCAPGRRRSRVALGHDVRVLARAAAGRAPTRCRRRRSAAAARRAVVGQREQRELHRVRRVDEDVELAARCRAAPCAKRVSAGGVPDDEAAARRACAASGPASATTRRRCRRRG